MVIPWKLWIDLEFHEVIPSSDREPDHSLGCKRPRFSWKIWRNNSHLSSRSISLIHYRHLDIQQRKLSILCRIVQYGTKLNRCPLTIRHRKPLLQSICWIAFRRSVVE